jgi:hypothetical protein
MFGAPVDPKNNLELLQDALLNLEGRVLIFDDFERCPMPLIVIASEQDIPKSQECDYRVRKEKLIGKTIKIGSNPAEVLQVFVKDLKQQEVLTTIDDNREKLLATFAASGRPNFRSLRAVLLDFELLVSLVGPQLRSSKAALGELLLYMVALGIEFRSNTIGTEDLRNLQNLMQLHFKPTPKTDDSSDNKMQATKLRKRYAYVSFDDPIVHPEQLANLFASGSIDIASVDEHINRHPAVVGYAKVPAWRLMWSWHEVSQNEYQNARRQLLEEFRNQDIIQVGEILHVAGIALKVAEYGEKLFDSDEICEYFYMYVDTLDRENKLEPAPGLSMESRDSYEGLMFLARETPEFDKIYKYIDSYSAKALDRKMRDYAPRLLEQLKQKPQDVSMLHEWGLDRGRLGGIPVLQHICISDFSELLLVDGILNKKLIDSLNQRYLSNFNGVLKSEVEWFKGLYQEMIRRAQRLMPPHQKLAISELERAFKDLNERIRLQG